MYTYVGEVVLSVNPYRTLDIYNDQQVMEYMGQEPYERPPHIFAVAESAYHDMKRLGKDSCIIISGKYFVCCIVHDYRQLIANSANQYERQLMGVVKKWVWFDLYG
jgi:hypothetical protein